MKKLRGLGGWIEVENVNGLIPIKLSTH